MKNYTGTNTCSICIFFLRGESDRVQNNNPKIQINRMGQRPNKQAEQAVGWKNDLPVNSALFSKRISYYMAKDVIELRILKWGAYPGLLGGPYMSSQEERRETERRWQCKDTGRAWCDPKTRNAGSHQKTDSPRPGLSEGVQPCHHLDFRLLVY